MTRYSEFLAPDAFAMFLFHGVILTRRHKIRNYTHKHITRDRFVEVVRDLQAHGTAVSLDDVVRATQDGTSLPPGAFVITFDDGFENNFSVAAPVLADMGIPAGFYVTSGFINENGSSWIDLIEEAVERIDTCRISLPGPGIQGEWSTPEAKVALLNEIRRVVKNDARIDPYEFARTVRGQLGAGEFAPDPDLDQKMTWEQVRELAAYPLFTVGGHSHTHRIMAFLSSEELRWEVDTSIRLVREHVERPVVHYSYPEGLANCYSPEVIRLLQTEGIVCSPSAIHGVNRLGDDLFHLKRVMVV